MSPGSGKKSKGKKRSRRTPAAGALGATTPDQVAEPPPAVSASTDLDSDTETEVERPAAATATDPDDGLIPWDDPDAVSMPQPDDLGSALRVHVGELGPAIAAASGATPAHGQPTGPGNTSLDPAAAAYEAARIAGEIVGDIESASGAAIARPRRPGRDRGGPRAARRGRASSADPGPWHGGVQRPVVTVRMQRDRILRALAEDIAANTEPAEARTGGRVGHPRAPSHPGRIDPVVADAAASPAADEVDDDDLDPVQVAAAAIRRMRQRASTDFAELRTHYHRHDIVVVMAAFLIIVIAGRIHARTVTPPTIKFEKHGLQFAHSQGWLRSSRCSRRRRGSCVTRRGHRRRPPPRITYR